MHLPRAIHQADPDTPLTFTLGEACVAATVGVTDGEFARVSERAFTVDTPSMPAVYP